MTEIDVMVSEHWLEIILFLVLQLSINMRVLFNLNQRLTKVETHIIHIMRKQGMNPRDNYEDS